MNELRLDTWQYRQLRQHLLRDDCDEYGALLLAGYRQSQAGNILYVREVHLLGENDFPAGIHGYKQFAASALARIGNRAAQEKLALVSVHSHPSAGDRNSLSGDDLRAHERVFPHLLDITDSPVVAGLAFGQSSVAGEFWFTNGARHPLDRVRVVGPNLEFLYPEPPLVGTSSTRFDRQVRLFGDAGQARLRALHVAVVGAGGGGSILIEQLAHLGVGQITAIDHDVVKEHNLSRIMGATEADARAGSKKIDVARRMATSIDPAVAFEGVDGDIRDVDVATKLFDADWVFLATDTAHARLVANAIAQSYMIPMVQIGAKVETRRDGEIEQIYTAVRPVLPGHGCLACAGLIDPMALQRESASSEERANQNYLGTADVIDPSVTTLNAAAASGALNAMLMSVVGLASDELMSHRITLTREGSVLTLRPEQDDSCRWCGTTPGSRFARADASLLPCRPAASVIDPVSTFEKRGLRKLFALLRG